MKKTIIPFGRLAKSNHKFTRFGSACYLTDAEKAAEELKKKNEATATKDAIMKELTTIKGALEENQKKAVADQQKNLDEKLAEVTKTLKELQDAKPEVTAEDFKRISDEAKITQKALDIVQTQLKNERMRKAGQPQNDESFSGQIKSAIFAAKEDILSGKIIGKAGKDSIQIKAVTDMTLATNLTGNAPNTYRPGIVPMPYELIHLRNLVNVTPSDTDSYHFYRHSASDGAIAFQAGENNTKAQIDEDFTEITVNLDYLAGWLKISRKMLRNISALQSYISRWLPERYYQTEDIKGHQVIIALAAGVGDTTGTDMISQIIRTIGLQKKARYNVNGIVVDGVVWAHILTYKATTSGEFTQPIGVVTISPSGQLMIAGIPVYTASWVAGDEAIVADWNNFEIIQSESLSLGFFEQDDKNVQQNKITARIEASVGFAMLDPKAFAVLSLASVS